MRTIFIGDVHGMLDTLDDLLKMLDLGPADRLVFLGDLVDKGPEPVGVVRRVSELRARNDIQTFVIRGNHEDKHLRYHRNLAERPKIAAQQARASAELRDFHASASAEDWETLHATLPFLRLDDLGILAVHGGIPGDMHWFPETPEDASALMGKDRDKFEKVWRTRFIDPETGRFVGLADTRPEHVFWAKRYDGRFGHVVYGHHAELGEPAFHPHATGLDTGAVYGGTLTAMICTGPEDRNFLSVPGKACSTFHVDFSSRT